MTPPSPSHRPSRREFLAAGVDRRQRAALPDPATTATTSTAPQPYLVRLARRAMACEFEVYLNAGQYPTGPQAALSALDCIDEVESRLTLYRDHSDLIELNRLAASQAVAVDEGLFELLALSAEIHRDTGGAWDPTTGPLTRAWGFFERRGQVPEPERLAEALRHVGFDKVVLDAASRTVRFREAGVELNLGSIGKGYALDCAARRLSDEEVGDYLLHGGQSSVLAVGSAAGTGRDAAAGWWIGISDPLHPGRRLGRVRLRDRALATAGSRVQFFRQDGRRYGHVLDPRSGYPAEGVLSATVLAPSAALADALSTAFYVMGVEETEQYVAQHPDISAILVTGPSTADPDQRLRIVTIGLDDEEYRAAPNS